MDAEAHVTAHDDAVTLITAAASFDPNLSALALKTATRPLEHRHAVARVLLDRITTWGLPPDTAYPQLRQAVEAWANGRRDEVANYLHATITKTGTLLAASFFTKAALTTAAAVRQHPDDTLQ